MRSKRSFPSVKKGPLSAVERDTDLIPCIAYALDGNRKVIFRVGCRKDASWESSEIGSVHILHYGILLVSFRLICGIPLNELTCLSKFDSSWESDNLFGMEGAAVALAGVIMKSTFSKMDRK